MESSGCFWADFASDFASFLIANGSTGPVLQVEKLLPTCILARCAEPAAGAEIAVIETKALCSRIQLRPVPTRRGSRLGTCAQCKRCSMCAVRRHAKWSHSANSRQKWYTLPYSAGNFITKIL